MKGNIYTDQKCPACNGIMRYDSRRGNCFCINHPDIAASKRYQVRFGKEISIRFNDIKAAEQCLTGLRFKFSEGTLDHRDYKKNSPLGFENLVEKWLSIKARQNIKPTTLANITKEIYRAVDAWHNRNIKTISSGDIEDFIYADHKSARGNIISDKTRANLRSTLNQFFEWVCRRESIPKPDIPHVSFELKWRNIVDIETQQAIIEEIKNISFQINPRIWLAIKILSHNQNIRPGELVKCKEGDVMLEHGFIWAKYPKEGSLKGGKQAWLWEDEIRLIQSFPRALPETPFFRHIKGQPGVIAGQQFHPKLLNNWWKRACKNLGIEGVTLYPGTKHSTMTAMSKELSPEQIRRGGSQHASKAIERYLLPNRAETDLYQKTVKRLQGRGKLLGNLFEQKKNING